MESKLDEKAQTGKTAILGYVNAGGLLESGAHYINLTWNDEEKQYVAHNSPKDNFESIDEFLLNKPNKPRQFISLTVIK